MNGQAMKIIQSVLTIILAFTAPVISEAQPNPSIKFSECFLKYSTIDGATEIVLYNLSFTKKTKMSEQGFKEMFDLTEFEITDLAYDSIEEPTAMQVIAKAKNFTLNTPVQQLFSNIIGEKTEVALAGGSRRPLPKRWRRNISMMPTSSDCAT
jgi:hypothetical protein